MKWEWLVIGFMLGFAGTCVLTHSAHSSERVDANIVSGLDVSDSISADELNMQLEGITVAMQSPVIQQAIARGRHHQIGFAVYLWSSGCAPVIEWRVIRSAEDAAAMVVDLKEAVLARDTAQGDARQVRGLTDISNALQCGATMLAESPFPADRDVLNIVANGSDNVGEGPMLMRDELSKRGVNVNAVAMPGGEDHKALVPYLQDNVVAGPFPFVIPVDKPEGLLDAWRRKFVGDMV